MTAVKVPPFEVNMNRKVNQKYDYDAVVIGAGVGGLTTGAYLARDGVKVLLCEQHNQPGGNFTSFKRDGYYFDGGIQACEDSNLLLPMLNDLGLLNRIDLVKSKFALAMPGFFKPLTQITDFHSFYEHLISVFPDEKNPLNYLKKESMDFCHVMEAMWQMPSPLFKTWGETIKQMPSWLCKYAPCFKHLPAFLKLGKIPIDEYLAQHLSDQDLINFLSQIGYRGSPASFSIPFIYFLMDYYYPSRGGVQAIPDLLAQCITENRGEIRYKTLVDEIMVENGRATGIVLSTGETIRSRFVVNNGDVRRTYLKMLPTDSVPPSYKSRLQESSVSESAFMVYLGVDIPPEELPVQGCQHILYIPDYKAKKYNDINSDPDFFRQIVIMISIPSLHDKTLAPEGKSVINISCSASMQSLDCWGTKNGKRTQRYRAIKKEIADQLIDNVEKIIPGLSQKIEVRIEATPFTFNRYTLNDSGTTSGWTYHPRETFHKGLQGITAYKTPLKNMYQVGHWGFSPGGAPAGFVTGKIVSSSIRRQLNR